MYVYNLCNKEKQNKSKFPEFGDLDNSHFANILLLIKTSKEE